MSTEKRSVTAWSGEQTVSAKPHLTESTAHEFWPEHLLTTTEKPHGDLSVEMPTSFITGKEIRLTTESTLEEQFTFPPWHKPIDFTVIFSINKLVFAN